jgi:hypothetical protein
MGINVLIPIDSVLRPPQRLSGRNFDRRWKWRCHEAQDDESAEYSGWPRSGARWRQRAYNVPTVANLKPATSLFARNFSSVTKRLTKSGPKQARIVVKPTSKKPNSQSGSRVKNSVLITLIHTGCTRLTLSCVRAMNLQTWAWIATAAYALHIMEEYSSIGATGRAP